jgi:DNA-binding response OmpR family regulator
MTGRELKPHDRTVDVTIRRIRKHFESTPDTPEIIATIHGVSAACRSNPAVNVKTAHLRRFFIPATA